MLADIESRGVTFDFRSQELIVSSRAADVGDGDVSMPIALEGNPQVSEIDHKFLSDGLRVLDPVENLSLKLHGTGGPIHLKTSDGYDYVVMPMARLA